MTSDFFRTMLLIGAVALVFAGCSGDADATLAVEQPAERAEEGPAPADDDITLPAEVFTMTASASLVGKPVSFEWIAIQRVFSPTLFGVGENAERLTLVHGRSSAGALPRVGGFARVTGKTQPVNALPESAAVPASPEATISAIYVEASGLELM